MSGTWGNNIKISIFGESHGESIGIVIDGIKPGVEIDFEEIDFEMSRRAPGKSSLTTARKESDKPEIVSGYFNGRTTGTPICALIRNSDTNSKDYSRTKDLMRPGHADYTGYVKYKGFNDYRGGGQFSGRLTAPIVFCGAVFKQILKREGVYIAAHVKSIGEVEDLDFNYLENSIEKNIELFEKLKYEELPFIDKPKTNLAKEAIESAKSGLDSVGGVVECAVLGMKAGVGDPYFDSIESTISHLMFSVPAVKGIEFGAGFEVAKMRGSECNDDFYMDGDCVKTRTNNNGGVLGGISNGMPIVFRVAVKPTPSIGIEQGSVNINKMEDEQLSVRGRHDPCIIPRIIPVIEAMSAIAVYDLTR
ncbi:MAG: chorismate synthase [Clostridioides sp.]|jgi:chorismate synthase|nr:chorismate synthase [Clostridioides sp.]